MGNYACVLHQKKWMMGRDCYLCEQENIPQEKRKVIFDPDPPWHQTWLDGQGKRIYDEDGMKLDDY